MVRLDLMGYRLSFQAPSIERNSLMRFVTAFEFLVSG